MVVLTCFGGKFKQARAITAIEENLEAQFSEVLVSFSC